MSSGHVVGALGLIMALWSILAVFIVHLDATGVSLGLAGMFVSMGVAYGICSDVEQRR